MNPMNLPLFVALAGCVWAVLCEIAHGRLRRTQSMPSQLTFGVRVAGWLGLVGAMLLTIAISMNQLF